MIADLLTKAVNRMLYMTLIKLLREYAVHGVVSLTGVSSGARSGGAVIDQTRASSETVADTAIEGRGPPSVSD